MRNTYIEENGQLYKEVWYEDKSGPLSLIRKGYVKSRRKNYKNTWQYKLWYWMPIIIRIGYGIAFAVAAIGAVIMTVVSFYAMWNALI